MVPFLGAGANLCGRPKDADWQEGEYPPSGAELAAYLAEPYGYPEAEADGPAPCLAVGRPGQQPGASSTSCTRSSAMTTGRTSCTRSSPSCRGACGSQEPSRSCGQLVLTTNYDDVLERAFAEAEEPVDVVVYETRQGEQQFVHLRPDGERVPIDDPATYREFALEERSVILKIHGDVDREERRQRHVRRHRGSLHRLPGGHGRAHADPGLPDGGGSASSDLLFLGYSMRDWNLRVILRQIWAEQGISTGGWSIQRNPSELDERFWSRQRIDDPRRALEDWVDGMRGHLG